MSLMMAFTDILHTIIERKIVLDKITFVIYFLLRAVGLLFGLPKNKYIRIRMSALISLKMSYVQLMGKPLIINQHVKLNFSGMKIKVSNGNLIIIEKNI